MNPFPGGIILGARSGAEAVKHRCRQQARRIHMYDGCNIEEEHTCDWYYSKEPRFFNNGKATYDSRVLPSSDCDCNVT